MTTRRCLGYRMWSAGLPAAVAALHAHAQGGGGGYACFANAHMIAEAAREPAVRRAMRAAAWVFPDGRPVAALVRRRGGARRCQVPGPEAGEGVLAAAAQGGTPVYLFGGSPAVLEQLTTSLPQRFPGLRLAGAHSPPFRAWTPAEEAADAARIRASGARLCLVALGCPKQELWMARHAAAAGCLCLGVGAAFAMYAGLTPRAPRLVRALALEWAWRWCQEPRRLARRYTLGNLRFAAAAWREVRTRRDVVQPSPPAGHDPHAT
jgi:N-acetylglucosaminyldiphosphoundecaprenol N-acetyl-beta-D-mannosaminyltransferase